MKLEAFDPEFTPDQRFNPHPPLLAGETGGVDLALLVGLVSIHTRHYWRVKHARQTSRTGTTGFNPHPPLLVGETAVPGDMCKSMQRFNPHPPLLAGETK